MSSSPLVDRLRAIPWRAVLLLSYVGTNLILIPNTIRLGPSISVDWQTFTALRAAIADGTIYELHTAVPFVWSPVAAWIMAGVTMVGYWPWLAFHVLAVGLLRNWLLIGLVLVSYGFWFDAAQGNTLTFSFVAGALALGGSRPAGLVYLGLMVLAPRPILLPLAGWLLWQRPDLRIPAVVLFGVHSVVVLATGYAVAWLVAMVTYEPLWPGVNAGPTALLGRWWLLIGIPLGAWLTWRGRVGWAGLAVSPYLTPQYLIWPLLELAPRKKPKTAPPATQPGTSE